MSALSTHSNGKGLIIIKQHGMLFAVLYEDNDCSQMLDSEDDVFLFSVFFYFYETKF